MNTDWRLQGQERYLQGVTLTWRRYQRYSASWDHDHCEFCGTTFAEQELLPEALHEGYTTSDNYHWICRLCFDDFKDRFKWTVADD